MIVVNRWSLNGNTLLDHTGKVIAENVDPDYAHKLLQAPVSFGACECLMTRRSATALINALSLASEVVSKKS